MTKEQILAFQAQNEETANSIASLIEGTIEQIEATAGKILVEVVPVAFEYILNKSDEITQEEFEELLNTYGLQHG